MAAAETGTGAFDGGPALGRLPDIPDGAAAPAGYHRRADGRDVAVLVVRRGAAPSGAAPVASARRRGGGQFAAGADQVAAPAVDDGVETASARSSATRGRKAAHPDGALAAALTPAPPRGARG